MQPWSEVPVDDGAMRAFVAEPTGTGPAPAIVVIQHAFGISPFMQEITVRLAQAGYVGVAPELYHRQDPDDGADYLTRMKRLRDDEVIQDVNATVEFLRGQPRVEPERIGILGFCMGGRVVYLMAGVSSAFQVGISFYGIDAAIAWGEGPSPFQRLIQTSFPLVGFFGEEDRNPSPADMKRLDEELTRLGKSHALHAYGGAGHGYMDSANPASYREQAARESWSITLSTLARYLAAAPAGEGRGALLAADWHLTNRAS